MISVSIIIPTYNVENFVIRTLLSVIKQKNAPEFEIIVIDDCSTDATLEKVSQFQREHPQYSIRIKRQEKNEGPAKARNSGMNEAKGEFLAYLDGDDYWEENFLCKTFAFLQEHPETVAVFTGQRHITQNNNNSVRPRCLLENNGLIGKEPFVIDDFFEFWRKEKYLVCTGSIVIRTALLLKLRGQREDLRICEDLELWCLIGLNGKIGFIPEILFTSDGMHNAQGKCYLLKKYIKRYEKIPSVDDWQKRHFKLIEQEKIPQSYYYVRDQIAQNLTNAMIIGGQYTTAQRTIITYGNNFPDARFRKLRQLSKWRFIWVIIATLIRVRFFLRLITL